MSEEKEVLWKIRNICLDACDPCNEDWERGKENFAKVILKEMEYIFEDY